MDGNNLALIRQEFLLSPDKFKAIVEGFKAECEHGLATASASGLATMIPSYVTRMPTGNEIGTYLALDLGGSTLRVSAVQLLGNGQVKVTEVRRLITGTLRSGTTDAFFDWIVDTIAELIENIPPRDDEQHQKQPLAMGVSWSFPLDQTGICKGTVLRMGKGFTLQGIDGQDLATLFSDACKRKGVNVVVTALLNDTVGALVAHAYTNPQARVGFIYGTGVNAAYPEKVSRITKLGGQQNWQESDEMLVNTEIDIFGSDAYLPRTRFDKKLDASHSQPDFQVYEKMMSGAYLGELTRLAAAELVSNKELFADQQVLPSLIKTPWSFVTAHMSEIERCSGESMQERQSRLCKLFEIDAISPKDVQVLTDLCEIVATRGAGLASAAIAAIIEQQPELLSSTSPYKDIVVGINGTTFDAYPNMPERMARFLADWFGQDTAKRIKLQSARDGGSIGGALVAMLYQDPPRTPTLSDDQHPPPPPPLAATTKITTSSTSSSSSSPRSRTERNNSTSTAATPVSIVRSIYGFIVSCFRPSPPRKSNNVGKASVARTNSVPNETISDEEKKL